MLAAVVACGEPIEPLRAPPIERRDRVVDYARDIQPLFAEHCWSCHGADEAGREADLRLDTRAGAVAPREGGAAIVPGDPSASQLVHRVRDPDPATRMPPGTFLDSEDIEALELWIRDGARYDRHWAYDSPVRPTVPSGATNPVDAFIDQALTEAGVDPSPVVDPATLLRRLSFDLTGLPPTLDELDAFLADPSEEAYRATVDRLLASDRHAEHLARDWLDYGGYAESGGLGIDVAREVWAYRDWVIDGFRRDRPLDELITMQLAGDTLGDPLGTTYLRLHQTIREAGIIDEEYRIRYAMDRAATVGSQLLGLTVRCAQCHDHRYDPIPQVDFYRLTACFDRISNPGDDLSGQPVRRIATPLQEERVAALVEERDAALEIMGDLSAALAAWEADLELVEPGWRAPTELRAHSERGATLDVANGRITATGATPMGDVFVLQLEDPEPIRAIRLSFGLARWGGNSSLGEVSAWIETPEARQLVTFEWVRDDEGERWEVADGIGDTQLYVGGESLWLVPREPIAPGDPLSLRLDQLKGAQRTFSWVEVEVSSDASGAMSPAVRDALAVAPEFRPSDAAAAVSDHFARLHAPTEARAAAQRVAELDRAIEAARELPRIRVMVDDEPERRTFVLERGNYLEPGVEVHCGVPEILTLDAPVTIADRADLAAWIVSDRNPTTARVLANHYFQHVFGEGLTRTPDDFGSRGERPTHPELLDWLAVELWESGWDLDGLLRLLVTSQAYRRSSHSRSDLEERDPDDRLWARAIPRRLDAEVLRDQALSVAGLLVEDLGGPSVRPYQPPGLYAVLNPQAVYRVDRGVERLHRRSMYTHWRRGLLVPSLELLDAPKRGEPIAHRTVSNTPTQALALLNEPLFVEAARHLADRMRTEGGPTLEAQIAFGFRTLTARAPTAEELAILLGSYDAELAEARSTGGLGPLVIGESARTSDDPAAHRAMTLVARVLLDLSETISRP